MSNRVTYRVTGDDWDSDREPLQAAGTVDPVEISAELRTGDGPDAPERVANVDEVPVAPLDESVFERENPAPASGVGDRGRALPFVAPLRTIAGALNRLPPISLGPRTVPAQPVVLAVAAVAVIGGFALLGGRPAASSGPTAAPSIAAPAETPAGCPAEVPERPNPHLLVAPSGSASVTVLGVAGPVVPFKENGDWLAAFGPVEATVPSSSRVSLAGGEACVVEWRAVAAQPPATVPAKWRPNRKDQLELGWQNADRERWAPNVPLPPRGEWVIRLTVWYRTAVVAPPTPAADASAPSAAPSVKAEPQRLVVERYFHLVIGAPQPAGS